MLLNILIVVTGALAVLTVLAAIAANGPPIPQDHAGCTTPTECR